jgi:hypothetical protein
MSGDRPVPSDPAAPERPTYDNDRLRGDLRSAWEHLARAQTFVPAHWKSDLQAALDHIEEAGSALCPDTWSKYMQPEYPEPKS